MARLIHVKSFSEIQFVANANQNPNLKELQFIIDSIDVAIDQNQRHINLDLIVHQELILALQTPPIGIPAANITTTLISGQPTKRHLTKIIW